MTPKEYRQQIKFVKDRYQFLKLTIKQAEQIFKYEEDKNSFSCNVYLSEWEEWDYEMTSFREILNSDQFSIYEKGILTKIKNYENSLIELDSKRVSHVKYHNELVKFYEQRFLPGIIKDEFFVTLTLAFSPDKSKIDFLKAEYKKFLNDSKKEIISNHFRHYRRFKPNELKASLSQHQLSYLWPAYSYFVLKMDEPAKATATYLKNKLKYIPEEMGNIVKDKLEQLEEFNQKNFKKYYGELKGWHVGFGQLKPEEEKEHRLMSLLLFDIERYGYGQ